jgi:hypothetical protein
MLSVGDVGYYINQNNNDKITKGKIVKETEKFFTLDAGSKEQRKKKQNVYSTEIELKADVIRKANYWLQEEYGISIPEAYKMFVDVIEEYPEKFV